MKFSSSPISGCLIVDIEPHQDERGMFARTWCMREFKEAGLPDNVVQCSLSRNTSKGTTRGLHFQLPPSQEGKLVRCTNGEIFDVIVDIRGDSPTFLQHFSITLSDRNNRALFIGPGCAHGFQTLEDDTDVFYQMTDYYAPDQAAGLRWNEPRLGIVWPLHDPIMHERDATYPDLDECWLRDLDWSS